MNANKTKEKYGGLRLAATGGNSEKDAIIDRYERDSRKDLCGVSETGSQDFQRSVQRKSSVLRENLPFQEY